MSNIGQGTEMILSNGDMLRLDDGKQLVDIAAIKITRKRFREPEKVEALAKSLALFGQLQPLIIEADGELVAGMRRLTAAKSLKWEKIWAVRRDRLDELTARSIELEENLQREDMTAAQKIRAIAELDRLKREQDPSWGQSQTAELAGIQRTRVAEAVKLNKMIELFPELEDAKDVKQLASWAAVKASGLVRIQEVRDHPVKFQAVEEKIREGDSIEVIKELPAGLFRAIITDSPFGIGYDKRKAGTEQSPTAYEDSAESYGRILGMAADFFRVLKDDGWLTFFLGPTHYERAKGVFRDAGFVVDEMPVVWDRSDGHCYTARPDRYYARGYDLALHCLKGNPEMTPYGRGKNNVLRFSPVSSDERELLVERPVELYQEIIKRLTILGETVADFFAGSGSVLAAAASLRRDYFGVEIDPARRAVAIKKVRAHTPS